MVIYRLFIYSALLALAGVSLPPPGEADENPSFLSGESKDCELLLSEGGRVFRAASPGREPKTWIDINDRNPLALLVRHWRLGSSLRKDLEIHARALSPDGKRIHVYADHPERMDSAEISTWDAHTRERLALFEGGNPGWGSAKPFPRGPVKASSLSPNGRFWALEADSVVHFFDLWRGTRVNPGVELCGDSSDCSPRLFGFSSDSRLALVGLSDVIRITPLAASSDSYAPLGSRSPLYKPASAFKAAAFSPDQKLIATLNEAGRVTLWSVAALASGIFQAGGASFGMDFKEDGAPVSEVSFNQQGDELLVLLRDESGSSSRILISRLKRMPLHPFGDVDIRSAAYEQNGREVSVVNTQGERTRWLVPMDRRGPLVRGPERPGLNDR